METSRRIMAQGPNLPRPVFSLKGEEAGQVTVEFNSDPGNLTGQRPMGTNTFNPVRFPG